LKDKFEIISQKSPQKPDLKANNLASDIPLPKFEFNAFRRPVNILQNKNKISLDSKSISKNSVKSESYNRGTLIRKFSNHAESLTNCR